VSTLIFVYGTLKRGCCNHAQLADQTFVGTARSAPGLRLHDMDGYPGIAVAPEAAANVTGEVWSVDAATLARLDAFEGVAEGLYRRAPVALLPPFHERVVEAYWPAKPVGHLPEIGAEWRE
jgi:gamma-glutamylcyclotransferase (GGCT)/AIG2-like uncharacterized protein YtfP